MLQGGAGMTRKVEKRDSGVFIAVEGGEGSGKSLFVQGLCAWLRRSGQIVVQTREPGGTPAADKIRAIFAAPGEELVMQTEALLVSAARCQHVERVIRPALARGEWVVSDRFADSTRVYQGAIGGVPQAELERLIAFSTGDLVPDLTILIDCPTDVARARIDGAKSRPGQRTDEVQRYDLASAEFHQRVRDAFLKLAKGRARKSGATPPMIVLDGAALPEDILVGGAREISSRWTRDWAELASDAGSGKGGGDHG